MNNNFEAIKSLVSLLVKKAGFDINSNYNEEELAKTKESIKKLQSEKEGSNNQKTLSKIIDALKLRQANWENNAEIVGKSLLNAYKEGKEYTSVKARIELLGNLASKGTENLSAGNLYTRLNELESKYNELNDKINTYEYKNTEEREMDEKYKAYLDNKRDSLNAELKTVNKELDELREVELKDVNIVNKIKDYIDKLDKDLTRIDRVLNEGVNTDISFEVYERLENAKNDLEIKQERNKDTLEKAEKMLENVRNNRTNNNNKKEILLDELDKCTTKMNNVSNKLKEDNYVNTTERIMDINEKEKIRLEIDYLKNKKDVIYVDASKVKEELIKEWSNTKINVDKQEVVNNDFKESDTFTEKNVDKEVVISSEEEIPSEVIEETKEIVPEVIKAEPVKSLEEILGKEELALEEKPVKEETKEVIKEEVKTEEKKNKRIELDW